MKKQNKRSPVDLDALERDIHDSEMAAGDPDGSAAWAQYRAAMVASAIKAHFGEQHDIRVYPKANGYGVVMMLRRPPSDDQNIGSDEGS